MKTVLLVDDEGSGEGKEAIELGTFDSPNADAVRQLLNVAGNAEKDSVIKITFEEWTDDQCRKAEIAGQLWAGEDLTPEERADWARLGGDPKVIPEVEAEL